MILLEMLLVLFLFWIGSNLAKAIFFKASRGGGFWGLADWLSRSDREKEFAEKVRAEVERQVAEKVAEKAKAAKGGKGEDTF